MKVGNKNGAKRTRHRVVTGLVAVVAAVGMAIAVPTAASAAELRGPFGSRGQCASQAQLDATNGYNVGYCFQLDNGRWYYWR